MELKYAKTAYRTFFVWGLFSALGMTVCTLVDSFLIGNYVGSDGLAVSSIASPVFLFYALLGITLGVGASIIIGRHLGLADLDSARRVFSSVLFTGLFLALFFVLLFVLIGDRIYIFLGADDALLPLARSYLSVVFLSAPSFVLFHILTMCVAVDGDPRQAALASTAVIIVNLSLDILFMKVLGWGIVGASTSLCIAELTGLIILLFHFRKETALLELRLRLPRLEDIAKFVANGFGVGSAFIFQALVMLIYNLLLMNSGHPDHILHIAVFGVSYTMSTIPYAFYDGASKACAGVVPILTGEYDQAGIMTVFKESLMTILLSGTVITLIFIFAAKEILVFFGIPLDYAQGGLAAAFRICSASILFNGLNTLCTAFWQSIGRAKLAATMSFLRNFVFMLLLGYYLIPAYQIHGLGAAYLGSELLSLILTVLIWIFSSSGKYVSKNFRLSGPVFEKLYPIEENSIEKLSHDLENLCDSWDVPPKQAFFINLVAEELILNIMKFAIKGKKKTSYVSLRLTQEEDGYTMRIRDNVSEYDPFQLRGDDIDRASIKLITQKAKYYEYQRKLVFNYLYIKI